MVREDPDSVSKEFDELAPDADETVRAALAERYAPTIAHAIRDYPWLTDPGRHLSKSLEVTRNTVVESLTVLYNPAQLDVLTRASVIAGALLEIDQATKDEHAS